MHFHGVLLFLKGLEGGSEGGGKGLCECPSPPVLIRTYGMAGYSGCLGISDDNWKGLGGLGQR